MILPYGSECIDMAAGPEPINSATGKVCQFRDEYLNILGRQDSSWNSAPFSYKAI